VEYIGIETQIRRNNLYSVFQLLLFPVLLIATAFVIAFALSANSNYDLAGDFPLILISVLAGTLVWFVIAFLFHQQFVLLATGASPLERKENKRVYNIVENLCISKGMKMPAVYIIHDDSLNAFASGINERTFSITLSKGIIEKLDDAELEGVIAHELSHIINRDVRLLIITIIFVGIFSFISEVAFRSLRFAGRGNDKEGKGKGVVILIVVVVTAVAYFISLFLRFGISRNREYMADAGAAEMTKNPQALASALRKISADPYIEAVESRDVAQLFIEHPAKEENRSWLDGIFETHPPIKKRIELLEQFT